MNKDERVSIKPDITFIQKSWQNIVKCSDQSELMVHEIGKVGDAFDPYTRDDALDCIDYSIYMDKTILKMEENMKGYLNVFGMIDSKIYDLPYNEFRKMSSNYTANYKQARKYYDLFYDEYDALAKSGYVSFYPYISEIEHDGKMSFMGELFRGVDPAPYAGSRPVTRVNAPAVNVPHESTNVSHEPVRENVQQSSTISKATAAPVQSPAVPHEETNTKSTSQSPVETPAQNNATEKTSVDTVKRQKSLVLAVILNIFLPGIGYFYAGKKAGLVIFIIALIFCWTVFIPIVAILVSIALSVSLLSKQSSSC